MSIDAKHQYRFQFLKSEEWKGNRKIVLARTKAMCEVCKSESWSNDAHHMKYRKGLQFVQEDFRVLCRRCHIITHVVMEHRKRMGEKDPSFGWRNTARSVRRIIRIAKIMGLENAIARAIHIFGSISSAAESKISLSRSNEHKTSGVGI